MKLRLVKIGNSYTVRIPHKIAEPFILLGEIDIRFPENIPAEKEKIINSQEPQKETKEETKWERIVKRYG